MASVAKGKEIPKEKKNVIFSMPKPTGDEFTLPSGVACEVVGFTARTVIQAYGSKEVKADSTMALPVLFSLVCKFNGNMVSVEALAEAPGPDYLLLQSKLSAYMIGEWVDGSITLPSGLKYQMGDFKAKHAIEAQRISGDRGEQLIAALIATVGAFNNEKVAMEDVLNLPGFDYLILMGKFGGFFAPESK